MRRWPTYPLSELGKVTTGSTPITSDSGLYGGDTPFVTPAELDQTGPVVTAGRTLSPRGIAEARLLPPDTVMVCCIGSLGKVGISGRTVATNQQINSIEFDQTRVWPRYGFYACRLLKPQLARMAPATTVAIVNKSRFEKLEIPVPPLAQQRRIAELLDKADALWAKRCAALAQLDSLTQSIFLDMFGDPRKKGSLGRTPTTGKLLGALTRIRTGKLDANAADYDGAYPFFTCAVEPLRINTPAFDCHAVLVAGNGDLNVKYYEGKFNAYQRTYVIESVDEAVLVPQFLFAFLELYVSELRKQAIGGVIKYIKLSYLTGALVQLPSEEWQLEFAQRLRAVEGLKTVQRASVSELEALFSSLQHRAFRGEL